MVDIINLAIVSESSEISLPQFKSQKKRERYFATNFSYIKPQAIYMGLEKKSVKNAGTVDVPCFGYVVPLKDSLAALLQFSEIKKFCDTRTDNVSEYYDGVYTSKLEDELCTIFISNSFDEVMI